jgi:hypothetical protein
MAQCSIIINVSDQPHVHSNGLSGQFIVPGKRGRRFRDSRRLPGARDPGHRLDNRKEVHYLKVRNTALDIMGFGSDASAHVPGRAAEMRNGACCSAKPNRTCRKNWKRPGRRRQFLDHNPPDVKIQVRQASTSSVPR